MPIFFPKGEGLWKVILCFYFQAFWYRAFFSHKTTYTKQIYFASFFWIFFCKAKKKQKKSHHIKKLPYKKKTLIKKVQQKCNEQMDMFVLEMFWSHCQKKEESFIRKKNKILNKKTKTKKIWKMNKEIYVSFKIKKQSIFFRKFQKFLFLY